VLRLEGVEVKYQGAILVLKGVSLEVPRGAIVALLGANGAGKTTTLKAISGLLQMEDGRVTEGRIEFGGTPIEREHPEAIVARGIVQVMEGRRIFENMTVEENLLAGFRRGDRQHAARASLERVYSYFPILAKLRHRISGYCSGGEQQMLVMGRALMARPTVMLLDEPSLGLSPLLVSEIFSIVRSINANEGTSILLVEQNALAALGVASFGYVMENGRVVLEGPSAQLKDNEDIKEFYFGLSELGIRRDYRQLKHYKRRKRWLG
jgi:branched-chain amino acid transport system ATP-binding protein